MLWLQESPMCAGDALAADPGPAFSWCTASTTITSAKASSHGTLNIFTLWFSVNQLNLKFLYNFN